MHISRINNINFKADIIKSVSILRKTGDEGYKPYMAKLAEFDINNPKDIDKLTEICHMPEFTFYGYELPVSMREGNNESVTKHCFALLKNTQDPASEIDKRNVLGLFTFNEFKDDKQPDRIPLFITNQHYRTRWYRDTRENEFMHIGHGMAQALQEIFPIKSIKCFAEPGAIEFWKKNGFQQIDDRWVMLIR